MIRDYQKGVHETLDVTLTNVGSAKNALRADGIFKNAFYDFTLYSDSAYTIPISSSAYESTTEDAYYTAQENDPAYTEEAVYSEYRVLDPTYQTGTIYARFESFGVYTSGEAVGQDLTVISASDTYTTNLYALLELFEASGLSADITITVTDGGGDQRNKFEYANIDSTYKVIVTDGTDTLWVMPGETVQFWFKNSVLTRSAGVGLIYDNYANNTGVTMSGVNQFVTDANYLTVYDQSTTPNLLHSSYIYISSVGTTAYGTDSGSSTIRAQYNITTTYLDNQTTSYHVKKIWRMYT